MKRKKFYAVYTMEDEIVSVYETISELNTFFRKPNRNSLECAICEFRKGKREFIYDKDKNKYKVYVMREEQ